MKNKDELYFEPESSGKKKNKEEKKDHKFLKLSIFLLFLLIIILIIIWLLKGKTTVSGQYPENVKNESLECYSDQIAYSKVNSIDSNNKEMRINAIFRGEEISSLSLRYTLLYSSNEEATKAEAIAHAQFNSGLQVAGYSSDKFSNKFTILDNQLIISLYANSSDIDEYLKDYLLIESDNGMPKTITEYEQNFKRQGFSCTSTLD